MRNMEKQIKMICSVCGNDQFSAVDEEIHDMLHAPDETEIKCSDCGRVTTKEQLIEENSHIIDANVRDFEDDIIKQLEKDLRKAFK